MPWAPRSLVFIAGGAAAKRLATPLGGVVGAITWKDHLAPRAPVAIKTIY